MQLNVTTEKKGKGENLQISDAVFAHAYNETLVHQVVTAYLAKARAGTHATKTRAQVSGGGAKPWRQKGTGRARAGSNRSPLWRGGGMTFAKQPRNYAQKVNRKMYRAAMRSMWSELIRQDRLLVVDSLEMGEIKTKQLFAKLNNLGAPNALIVTASEDAKLILAARNLPHVDVCTAGQVTPLGLVAFDKVIVQSSALRQIEEALA
jgi:large subunit ribosomal protein L4